MPTMAEIKKSAKEIGFYDDMEALGFTPGPDGFWFYRYRGEFLDIVDIWRKSSGNWIQFPLETAIGEMFDDYDMSNFPKGFLKGLSNFTTRHITKRGVDRPWHSWDVRSDENLRETFTIVSELMSTKVDAWFKNIDSRAKIYETISPSVKDGPWGSELRKILL